MKSYVLEVDLEYPEELSELHNDYPLAPGKTEIKRKLLSKYQVKTADLFNVFVGKVKKIGAFFGKERYVLHYENLQFYLRLGFKLKIHHVLEFNQSQ